MTADLVVPAVEFLPRWSRTRLGRFVGEDAFVHFLGAYRSAMAELPPFSESTDVSTSFGTVRAYHFEGLRMSTPVVLLPGRNASTPMWGANLPALLKHRTAICVDLLGEAGLSVQDSAIRGVDDEAQWLDEALAGLGLDRAHVMGVSIGGWTAVNYAARRPGRAASLVLLDPVFTFAPVPPRSMLVAAAMSFPGTPEALRSRAFSWISGGADVDDSVPQGRVDLGRDHGLRPAQGDAADDHRRPTALPGDPGARLDRRAQRDARRGPCRAAGTTAAAPRGQVELWAAASHAIHGEYPAEIAETAAVFWDGLE